jgi:4,5-DOPA dioxygenase extradiol
MFAVEPGLLGPRLADLGQSLDGVRAVLVVSPHWQTHGLRVMGTARPDTIHDFGGFPPVLYTLRYDVAGAPDVATRAATLLANAGFAVTIDEQRGLDHGAWVPMRHLRPQGDLPVFQVSLPHDIDAAGALRLGAALAPLREQGVMIVGSGSMTHNLYEFRQHIQDPEYAQQFADWIQAAVARRDVDGLVDYRRQAPHAQRAHPTEEHYLPLLVALGASGPEDAARFIEGGMTYGVLSMDSYLWSAQ